MGTFSGTYRAEPMMSSVAWVIGKDIDDEKFDIHTITLILNGQHGEFDLVVEATDDDLEDHRWEGVAHRSGGVAGFKKVGG